MNKEMYEILNNKQCLLFSEIITLHTLPVWEVSYLKAIDTYEGYMIINLYKDTEIKNPGTQPYDDTVNRTTIATYKLSLKTPFRFKYHGY